MKPPTEMVEGPKAWKNFDAGMGRLLSVSHDEIKRREQAYREQAAQNPNRRGPKPKAAQR